MIRIELTQEEYYQLGRRLWRERDLILSGRHGVAEHRGCAIVYRFDGVELTLEVTIAPWWVSRKAAERRLLGWVGMAGAPHAQTTLAASVALALCATLLAGALAGCTDKQQQTVKAAVAEIGQEIPKLEPLITAAAATADVVLPTESPLITLVTTSTQVALATLARLCDEYAASPTDSIWQSIVAVIAQLETGGAQAILDAAHITNPQSRAVAQAALGALQTAILLLDGVIQRTRTPAENAAAAQARRVKLSQLAPYLDHRQVEEATGHSFGTVIGYETALGY